MNTVPARLAPLVLCLAAILAAPLPAQAQQNPAPATPTAPADLDAEQWREDLRFMVAEMERRHPDLHHSVSREDFAAAVADLDARIPRLERNEVIVGLMRIAAMIGDGHTRVDPRKDARFGFPSLPLRLYWFEDGLHVRAAAPAHADLVGARIEAIGGVPVEEALRRAVEISAGDNAMGPRLLAPVLLAMPDILHALGLSGRRDAADLTLRRGDRRWIASVPAGQVDPLWPPDTDISLVTPAGWVDARTSPLPLWLQAPLDYHGLVELPDRDALYVQLNMVTHIDGQTLAQFGERIAERAAALNPRAVILDLRLDLGGNGDLRNRFVPALIRAEDADTRLFVLTGRGTFSASQFILDDLDRLTGALFIGEPAASKPSSFGDSYRTALPNSGISIRTSIYWWQSGQNRDPWTWVDVAAPLTFADYVAGRDPALEAALAFEPEAPLADRLAAAAASSGAQAVRAALEDWRTDLRRRWANQPLQMIIAAERLEASGQRDAALVTAETAARLFPASVGAALLHAMIAEAAGQADLARREAGRVVMLDPHNRFVRPLLARLGAGQ